MKKLILISLIFAATLVARGQKMHVTIVADKQAGNAEWQILDENYFQVFNGSEAAPGDSAFISLETDRHYILQLSIKSISEKNLTLCSIVVDGEPVVKVPSSVGTGDFFYPFVTGSRKEISKIIGGSSISITQYPWQIYLVAGQYMCGGSIISKDYIMTAAHCVTGIAASNMHIIAGATNPYASGTRYNISEVHVNEGYNSTTLLNDIAILKTSGSIDCTYCTPIKLVNTDLTYEGVTDPGVMTTITGWGLTQANPAVFPVNLQVAQVPIVSNATAMFVWSTIPSTDIMAGYYNGNKDACSGDSGGPMSIPLWGEYRLAGIVSWGSKNCDTYGGYTRVASFDAWIKNITGTLVASPSVPAGDSAICPAILTSTYTTEPFTGASSYEWQLYPSGAGTISGGSLSSTVTWNKGYVGDAKVRVRALTGSTYTEWGTRKVKCGLDTRLTSQPADTFTCEGTSIDLRLEAYGTSLNYDWYKNGAAFQNPGGFRLYLDQPLPSQSGAYQVKISGVCGIVTSNVFNLSVYPLTAINSISLDVMANYGDNVVLDVSASGHNLTYLWKQNGTSIQNSNTSELSLPEVNARNIGIYNTVVTGTCGILSSDSVYVYLRRSDASTGVEVSVWPTVVTGEVNVAVSGVGKYDIRIVNLSGKTVLSYIEKQYQTTINMTDYPKGIYIMNIKGNAVNKSFKIFRQ